MRKWPWCTMPRCMTPRRATRQPVPHKAVP
jgi:hypothetical protein